MSIRGKLTLITLSAFIAVYSVVGGMLSRSGNPYLKVFAQPGPYPQLRIFEEVVSYIIRDYVEKPDLEKVRIGALRGLTDGLDQYSAYLLPDQVKEYKEGKAKIDTTGIVIGEYVGFAYVIAVVPNSPGEKAGVRVGDIIEYIDKHATRDLDLYDVKSLLRGAPGTSVDITLLTRKPEKIKIIRGNVPPAPIDHRIIESNIGYVKVPILTTGQSTAVATAVKDVLKKGAKSLILDLRGSAGGELIEGVTVADYFLKTGGIAKTIGRKDKVLATYDAKPDNDLTDIPVAVIMDSTTAGASQIIAASIMDNKRGDAIGSKAMFGMGSEQELFPLDDGSALLLTVSRYASPSGKIFMAEGLTPNIEVKRPDVTEGSTAENEDKEKDKEKDKTTPPAPQVGPAGPDAPPVVVAPKSADDLMLKKAVEVLKTKKK